MAPTYQDATQAYFASKSTYLSLLKKTQDEMISEESSTASESPNKSSYISGYIAKPPLSSFPDQPGKAYASHPAEEAADIAKPNKDEPDFEKYVEATKMVAEMRKNAMQGKDKKLKAQWEAVDLAAGISGIRMGGKN